MHIPAETWGIIRNSWLDRIQVRGSVKIFDDFSGYNYGSIYGREAWTTVEFSDDLKVSVWSDRREEFVPASIRLSRAILASRAVMDRIRWAVIKCAEEAA
jgi:hypothetical protein